jgi:multidrug efflux pump subunit AcrB
MRNMSAWAIRHPISPIVLFVVLLFMGTVAFVRLPITLNPDIAFPLVLVQVLQPGAAPTDVETQILQKVEGSVAGIGNIHNITSLALEGQCRIFIEFNIGTPIDRAVADVRDAVAKIRVQLPEGIQEPIVQRQDVDGGAIVYYALSTTTLSEQALSWFVDNTVTKRLLGVPGVAQVSRGGGVNREIRVELDPARMQALGITAVQVNQQIRQLNLDSPGGRAQVGGGEQAIRVLGGARTALQLAETQIMLPGNRFARLSDIANVRDSVGEVRSVSRLNGRAATTFGVFKAKGFSDVAVLDAVHEELGKISKENPQVKLTQVFTTVDYTKKNYESALSAFLEGSVLAVLVVWFFLRDTRATLISALAIPLSAIPTFAFMQWMNFTLNSISLLALSLVAGVLVDDAIVEIENIVRHMRMGKTGFQASLDAADQIGLAVVATSCTIIAVFTPVSFMGGITGQYFKQFGLTVAAAVFFSLLVARLITPVIAAYTLKSERVATHTDGPVMAWYVRALRWSVHNRWKTLAAGSLFFALSVVGLILIPKSFVPESDNSSADLQLELPPGVRLEDTAAASAAAYRIVARHPEATDIVESIGADEFGEVRSAELYITLVPPKSGGSRSSSGSGAFSRSSRRSLTPASTSRSNRAPVVATSPSTLRAICPISCKAAPRKWLARCALCQS